MLRANPVLPLDHSDQYRATMTIATTRNKAISQSVRSVDFDRCFATSSERMTISLEFNYFGVCLAWQKSAHDCQRHDEANQLFSARRFAAHPAAFLALPGEHPSRVRSCCGCQAKLFVS
jgi:hypothetical protein